MRVIDFFCGCGGASKGFELAGFTIALGLDFDRDAASSYTSNFPDAEFINDDIRNVSVKDVAAKVPNWHNNDIVLCACAPCQPFSKQNQKKSDLDPRRNLLNETKRFVRAIRPAFIFIENVPGIQTVDIDESSPLSDFLKFLTRFNYRYELRVISSENYGVPQRRKRLVLLASLERQPVFPTYTHGEGRLPYSTVRDYIGHLPPIQAGEMCSNDEMHTAPNLESITKERMRNTPEGGDRRNWPKNLLLECHKSYKGHTDVYGRMYWDQPCNTLTTKCTSISNGRFGHPDVNQVRAISFREAALLQTFPSDFTFIGNNGAKSRQIGNAVPVLLAQKIAESIWQQYYETIATRN